MGGPPGSPALSSDSKQHLRTGKNLQISVARSLPRVPLLCLHTDPGPLTLCLSPPVPNSRRAWTHEGSLALPLQRWACRAEPWIRGGSSGLPGDQTSGQRGEKQRGEPGRGGEKTCHEARVGAFVCVRISDFKSQGSHVWSLLVTMGLRVFVDRQRAARRLRMRAERGRDGK